mmetsp:Transcript_65589/g.156484  ORF Transcript_65589/g.156484 Transcript_65589/m.156484 type:complete len:237 (-) Transcript_65589:125-835(-)
MTANMYAEAAALGKTAKVSKWGAARIVRTTSNVVAALGDGNRLIEELAPGYFGIPKEELELVWVDYPQDDHAERLHFAGQMRTRSKCGLGCAENRAGVRYEGHWRNNQRNGLGVETTPDGIYEGQFTDDKRDGFGVFVKKEGPTYVGEWKKGDWHGHGMVQQETHSGGVKESFFCWEFGFNVAPGVDSMQELMRARVIQVQKEAVRVGAAARDVEKEARRLELEMEALHSMAPISV